jgi:hypothetical protein
VLVIESIAFIFCIQFDRIFEMPSDGISSVAPGAGPGHLYFMGVSVGVLIKAA